MNTDQTIRDFTIAYIENALAEVALLHDEELIVPTLEKFHIERHHARIHGFTPKQGKFNPHAGSSRARSTPSPMGRARPWASRSTRAILAPGTPRQ